MKAVLQPPSPGDTSPVDAGSRTPMANTGKLLKVKTERVARKDPAARFRNSGEQQPEEEPDEESPTSSAGSRRRWHKSKTANLRAERDIGLLHGLTGQYSDLRSVEEIRYIDQTLEGLLVAKEALDACLSAQGPSATTRRSMVANQSQRNAVGWLRGLLDPYEWSMQWIEEVGIEETVNRWRMEPDSYVSGLATQILARWKAQRGSDPLTALRRSDPLPRDKKVASSSSGISRGRPQSPHVPAGRNLLEDETF